MCCTQSGLVLVATVVKGNEAATALPGSSAAEGWDVFDTRRLRVALAMGCSLLRASAVQKEMTARWFFDESDILLPQNIMMDGDPCLCICNSR
jgi:hypothetical protein